MSELQGGDSCLPPAATAQLLSSPLPCCPGGFYSPGLLSQESCHHLDGKGRCCQDLGFGALHRNGEAVDREQPWPLWRCWVDAVSATWLLEWPFFLARGCAPRAGPGHCLHSPPCESAAFGLGSKRGTTSCEATGVVGFQGASWLPASTTPAVCSAHSPGRALTCACAKSCP